MVRFRVAFMCAAVIVAACVIGGCSQKTPTTAATSAGQTKTIAIPKGKLPVTLGITGVAISTAAAPVLRIDASVTNGKKSMILCDPAYFFIELADGTTIAADQAADSACNPDSLDPKAAGTVRMFFDLGAPYAGKLTLIMESSDGKVVGTADTVIH